MDERTLASRAASLRGVAFDVDGVLTDGRLWYGPQGELIKAFDAKDGLGLQLLRREGIDVAVISARGAAPLRARLEELGVNRAWLGSRSKAQALDAWLDVLDASSDEVAYMGDDLLDLPVLRRVALSIAPADASADVRSEVDWVTEAPGGRGAVREVSERILGARGRWGAALEALLEEKSA